MPDADLFESLSRGDAEIVTDTIAGFTETGIELGSGGTLEADVIVTATGLQLQLLGGIDVAVDGTVPEISGLMTYKAMMLEGVPNLAFSIGYTNASWTLKADLTAEYVCRVLEHMDREGHRVCVPVNDDPSVQHRPLLDFTSGYVQRSLHELPKSGSKRPWRLRMNYPADVIALRHGRVDDGVLRFSGPYAMPAETLGSTVGTAPMSAGSS